ncbi:hypothetical protein EDM54_12980 [Brevibacillus borstelensis]|nr:hypothetical protein EDM54_12980 [Brevibacillus borstelensis]GED55805.1 hypothetical protein BBO01nite_50460 [Brevibacillus borstelensis]
MNNQRQWFPLPDLYRTLDDPETLIRFAAAYMRRYYPEWEPIKINNYRVLVERRGREMKDDAVV